jgi:hypothetical protein
MSDNTAQLVADLTACRTEVDSLEATLATAQEATRAAEAEAARLAADLAAANAALSEAQAGASPQEIADLEAQLAAAEAEAERWQTNADAWAAKYDLLYGPVEPGIAECPGYVTDDGRHHATLDAARRHVYATTAEAQAMAARLGQPVTQSEVDELAALGMTLATPVPAA